MLNVLMDLILISLKYAHFFPNLENILSIMIFEEV